MVWVKRGYELQFWPNHAGQDLPFTTFRCPDLKGSVFSLPQHISPIHKIYLLRTHAVSANQRTVYTEWCHRLTALLPDIPRPKAVMKHYEIGFFPWYIVRFMIWRQLVTTDESLSLHAFFSARKLTKWYSFCVLSNHHVARCFLHYLVIWTIRLADQNVQLKIKILRKITVTQFFWTDRSEEKVQNFTLDSISACGIFLLRWEFWSLCTIFAAWIQYIQSHVILNLHTVAKIMLTWAADRSQRVIETNLCTSWKLFDIDTCWYWHDVAWWKSLFFLLFLETSCHFICFLVFIHFFFWENM